MNPKLKKDLIDWLWWAIIAALVIFLITRLQF